MSSPWSSTEEWSRHARASRRKHHVESITLVPKEEGADSDEEDAMIEQMRAAAENTSQFKSSYDDYDDRVPTTFSIRRKCSGSVVHAVARLVACAVRSLIVTFLFSSLSTSTQCSGFGEVRDKLVRHIAAATS